MFQSFGEESKTVLLIFYLFLGFFLLIHLISIIMITLSEDDQILININTEDEEASKDVENCDKSIQVSIKVYKYKMEYF